MTTKYIARHNGQIIGKRTTKDRTYTHAVVELGDETKVLSWAGRRDLAEKAAAGYRRVYRDRERTIPYYGTVIIVPAEIA